MSSKSIHHTSNKKFSDLMQLSKQHNQIEICEASHFCIILELIAYKLFFFFVIFMEKMNSCSRCIFYLFLELKDSLLSV